MRAPGIAALLLWPSLAFAQSTTTVKGLDVYRSRRLDAAKVRETAGPLLDSYLRTVVENRRGTEKAAARLKAQVEDTLRRASGAAFLSLFVGRYVTSAERTAYLTVDVVDPEDAAARMPFRAAPRGQAPDPDGLLAAWQQYDAAGDALVRAGQIDGSVHPSCPGFYCLWGSGSPELAALEKKMSAGAPARKDMLLKVLKEDADARKRAQALFVLSYLPDGKQVADLCLDSLADPAEEVRAAALQILSDVALYHKSVLVDLSKILPALDFPTVSDRAKALSVMIGLSDNPAYKTLVMTRGTPYLLGLLRLRQPANHDLAFTLLSTLSSQTIGQRDYAGWNAWIKSQNSAAREVPGVSTDEPAR
jgi:hypothetical protein